MTVKQSSAVSSVNLDSNPGYQLWLAANSLQRALRKGLEPFHLTFVQYFVLAAVSRLSVEHEEVSQAQVCRFCGTDPNMTSTVARTLEKKGLLKRSANSTDRRAHNLTLTLPGETLVIAARERLLPLSESFFGPLGDRQSELADMLRQVVTAAED